MFPDASRERADILRALLAGGVNRTVPSPPLVVGWNVRLVLEEPDPIHLFEIGATPPRNAVGLFDARQGSLALLEGGSITSFGADTCLGRIVARVTRGEAFDLPALRITATPHRLTHHKEGVVVLKRPLFDLAIEGLNDVGPIV